MALKLSTATAITYTNCCGALIKLKKMDLLKQTIEEIKEIDNMYLDKKEVLKRLNNIKKEHKKQLALLGVSSSLLEITAVSNSKRESLENFSELLKKVIEKTKASDNGLIYCDAGDIMQDVCDNYTIIKK